MAGQGGKFNLLKQPNTWQCLKLPHDSRTQDCQQRKNIELIENIRYVAMLKNSAMFENTDEDVSHGNTTRFSATELSIFEGTTRLPATGKNLSYSIWSHQHGNVWKYHKIAGHGGTLKLLKHTQYLAISEDTPSLPPTVEYLNHWSHQICGNVWKYRKIADRVKFELLKPPNILQPPNIWQYLKIQQDCQKRAKLFIYWSHQIFRNVWKYHRIGGHGGNWSSWSHPIFCHIWKYNKIFSREEIFELLKTPNMWQCSRIPQNCRPRGKA